MGMDLSFGVPPALQRPRNGAQPTDGFGINHAIDETAGGKTGTGPDGRNAGGTSPATPARDVERPATPRKGGGASFPVSNMRSPRGR